MKVKIDNTWHTQELSPIAIELTEQDKINIANMAPDAKRYAIYPASWTDQDTMRSWIRDE